MRHATAYDLARQAALRTSVMVATLIALLIIATAGNFTAVARAAEEPANPVKAVIIVGPTHSATADLLVEGELFAVQAEAAGMAVTRVFHPYATWSAVQSATQGANLVVYFGHGNGWPSPYGPFQEATKNGFALNRYEGASPYQHVYYGGNVIREKVRLAPNAVVILYRACYAAGNGEEWHRVPSRSLALRRVDNFAASFLHKDVRAGVVMAFRTKQWVNLAAALMRPGKTMNSIFRISSSKPGWRMSGWMGRRDIYRESTRTRGAYIHLDPHPTAGFSRAITGDLRMTTREWMGR